MTVRQIKDEKHCKLCDVLQIIDFKLSHWIPFTEKHILTPKITTQDDYKLN